MATGPVSKAPVRPHRAVRGVGIWVALWLGLAARAGDTVLIPSEDNRWDGAVRKAIEEIRTGEYRTGIQALQELVDDAACRRALKPVWQDFTPRTLESGFFQVNPPVPPVPADPASAAPGALPGVEAGLGPAEAARPLRPAACLYLPVTEVARRLLGGLSPEAVQVYRRLYGTLTRDLLREARAHRDLDLLRRLCDDYALAETAAEAQELLGEALFEEGRFWSALVSLRRAAGEGGEPGRSPGPAAASGSGAAAGGPAALKLKILVALRFLGREAEYQAEKGALGEERAEGPGGAVAAGWLREFEEAHPFPSEALSAAPGMEAGPPPRLPGRRLGFDWNSPFWAKKGISRVPGPSGRAFMERRQSFFPEREPVRSFNFFPTVGPGGEEGLVTMNGVFTVQRLSLGTGRIEPPSYRQPPEDAALLYFQEASESPVYAAACLPAEGGRPATLISTYLSKLVQFRAYMGYEITADIPTRSLAAFESESGRLLWRTGGLTLGREGGAVSITTPVLVKGGRVFAGGWQQHGYIDGVLVALDAATGSLLWHQLLASSQMEGTMFGELAREPFGSALVEQDGILYYPTNLGAVAALEAKSGRILWITTYDSIEVKPAEGRRSEFRKVYWGVNPPLLVGDTLIVTPRDSMNLYAIDTAQRPGRILWSYSNLGGELRDLLGYASGRLYFTGPGGVQALDVRDQLRQGAGSAEGRDGSPARPRRIPGPNLKAEEGRGVLTGSGVLLVARAGSVPAGVRGVAGDDESRLFLVDLSLTSVEDLSGPLPRSDLGTHGGNVSIAGDKVILTSRDLVAAFSPRPERVEPAPGVESEPPPGGPTPEREKGSP